MLRFYFIAPNAPKARNAEGLEEAAAFSMIAYEVLLKLDLIEKRYNFFMDFRWNTSYVARKVRFIDFFLEDSSHPETQRFIEMIHQATKKEMELIAYAQ
jgi:hypothetical protein